ncbi:hypothetical protein BsWGS_15150 [Bradybaena similaris]
MRRVGVLGVLLVCFLGDIQPTQSKQLKVTSLLVQPFLMTTIHTINGTTQTTHEGYIPDLLDELAKLTGLTFTFSVRADAKYGHRLPNGSWDGLIGDIVDGVSTTRCG